MFQNTNDSSLENAVNKPFSRAALFIFSPAEPLSPRVFSLETEIQSLKYNHLINSPHFLQSNCQLARF